MPSFSVVMPLYNKAPHVARAIKSVLDQDFADFELIVVDDASDDGSLDEVYRFSDPRIQVLQRTEPGAGGYAARNLGINHACSTWIAFLDADDEWLPHHLSKMRLLQSQFPTAGFLACGWLIDDGNERVRNPFLERSNTQCRLLTAAEYLKVHASGLDVVNTDVAVVKKALIKEVGGFPDTTKNKVRAGDGKTWLAIMLLQTQLAWSPHIGSVYHQDAVNMVTRRFRYEVEDNCLIMFIEKQLRCPHARKFRRHLKLYRNRRALSLIFQNVRYGSVRSRHLFQVFKYFIFDARVFFIILGFIFPGFSRWLVSKVSRA